MNKKEKTNRKLLINIINTFSYVLIMLLIIYIENNNNILPYKNKLIILTFSYLLLIAVFGKLFSFFDVGETTTTDLFISHSLTLLFSNIILYCVGCLISNRFVIIIPLLIIQIIEMLLSIIVLPIEVKHIRKTFLPLNYLCLYDGEYNELIGKLNNPNELSIKIIKTINVKEIKLKEIDKEFDNIDGVITLGLNHNIKLKVFNICYKKRIIIYDMPDIADMLLASGSIMHIVDTPIIKANKFGPNTFESVIKRIIDIIVSFILIIITSPIMLITAIAIKMNDGGVILYKQKRLTKNNREFTIYKFRSMIMDAELLTGAVLAKENDNRITKVGKIIRKFRIDELPQMFNILKGDMSLVGPRPERKEIYNTILKELPEFEYRLCVKAGLTGYAQIYGKYNTTLKDKLLLDLYYIEKYSLIEDIKLLILTIKVIFKKDSTEGIK